MSFGDWLADTKENIRRDGLTGINESLYQLYLGAWRRFGKVYNYGTPVYDREWDLLVVLDACRADLLSEVADDYEFLSTESTYAPASTSAEWMEKCFLPSRYRGAVRTTGYVSGNPFTDEVFFRHLCPQCESERSRAPGASCDKCGSELRPERTANHEFGLLDEVWQTGWDDELGTIPPRKITDHAIAACRSNDHDRVIAHYMQPHHPFIESDIDTRLHPSGFGEMGRESVWDLLRTGDVEKEQVWRDYRDNLRYVLNDVRRLLRNVDADRVVITADHANAVGEFGLYGHYRNVPIPAMKRVPWCVTNAENVCKDRVDVPNGQPGETSDVESRLEDLGYL